MVKIAKQSSQHPTDSSLQMKVMLITSADQPVSGYGKKNTN